MTVQEDVRGNCKADINKGVIENVKFLGYQSQNGYRYSEKAVDRSMSLLEGKKVYINHSDDRSVITRRYEDWVGVAEGCHRIPETGGWGKLRLNQKHPLYPMIMEAAEKFPTYFGMSITGNAIMSQDRKVVEDMEEIFSIDIVTDPATNKGLFESTQRKPAMKSYTFQQVLKELEASTPHYSVLENVLKEIPTLGQAVVHLNEQATPEEKVRGTINEIILGHAAKMSDDQFSSLTKALGRKVEKKTEGKTPKEGPKDDITLLQERLNQVEKQNQQLAARNMLLEAGVEPTQVRVNAIAAIEESDRQALVESWKGITTNQEPVKEGWGFNGAKPESSPPKNGELGTEDIKVIEERFNKMVSEAEKKLAG